MSRIIAILACGFALAACSMSMPSLDYFRSGPPTEVLRVESEPPGADARTTAGEACRTPCELTVASGGDIAVTFALNGYQSITVPVHAEAAGRLQPNPVYAELQPAAPPPRPGRKRPAVAKNKPAAKAVPPASTQGQAAAPEPAVMTPGGYPWPPPPPPQ